mmetsp:Transcript_42404/g.135866  ORF Transcript_42404/g.135866 Transcript_42404/m.135866 type:complete len:212 (-) Transcript_42404:2313-2948(-)
MLDRASTGGLRMPRGFPHHPQRPPCVPVEPRGAPPGLRAHRGRRGAHLHPHHRGRRLPPQGGVHAAARGRHDPHRRDFVLSDLGDGGAWRGGAARGGGHHQRNGLRGGHPHGAGGCELARVRGRGERGLMAAHPRGRGRGGRAQRRGRPLRIHHHERGRGALALLPVHPRYGLRGCGLPSRLHDRCCHRRPAHGIQRVSQRHPSGGCDACG